MAKVALIGLGTMGKIALKILHNKNATITAVFNRTSHVGQDAGEVAGIGHLGKRTTVGKRNYFMGHRILLAKFGCRREV